MEAFARLRIYFFAAWLSLPFCGNLPNVLFSYSFNASAVLLDFDFLGIKNPSFVYFVGTEWFSTIGDSLLGLRFLG